VLLFPAYVNTILAHQNGLVVATTSQKTNSNISNKSQDRYQVEIIRELDKKSPMYCYLIYIIDIWSMLTINNPTLISMYCP